MHYEESFENELGNQILVETKEQEIDGIAGVRVYIAGPKSETELHITRMEAVVLCEQLMDLLTDNRDT